jgi:uncharacterized coiled-coil protein SlyX
MSTSPELRALHDRLLEVMPDGAEHKEGDCPLCTVTAADETHRTQGGVMPEFTQADIDAAVAAATGPLQQRLGELEAQAQQSEVGQAVAAAVADKDTQITDLQTQLDAAVAGRTAAESKLTEAEQFWTDAIAAHEEAVATAARKETRIGQAKDIGVFNDDYIVANADRFAQMSDDDFAARIEEWKLIAAAAGDGAKGEGKAPAQTAMVASRTDQAGSTPGSVLGRLAELRARNANLRTVGGHA